MNIKANKIGVDESFLRDWLFVKKKSIADLTRETGFTGGHYLCEKYGIKVPSSKDVMQRPEFRRKRSEISLRDWQNSFYREKHIKGMKGAPNTRKGKPRLEQRKFKHSKEEMEKLIKEGKTYKEICDIVKTKDIYYYLHKWNLRIPYKVDAERIRKSRSHGGKQNKPEKQIQGYLDSLYPKEWLFTGCGEHTACLGNHIPDFMNCNGKKQVIEHLGTYWHHDRHLKDNPDYTREQEEFKLKEHYNKFGFDCLCIWEDELKDEDAVCNKIKGFVSQ